MKELVDYDPHLARNASQAFIARLKRDKKKPVFNVILKCLRYGSIAVADICVIIAPDGGLPDACDSIRYMRLNYPKCNYVAVFSISGVGTVYKGKDLV